MKMSFEELIAGMSHDNPDTSFCTLCRLQRIYREEVVPLVEALKNHIIALDDWLNIHASDFCSEERVREALARIGEKGTISYIAKLQRAARAALSRFDAPAEPKQ